jgi:hypothetical protein
VTVLVPRELSGVVAVVLVYWAIAMLAKAAVKRKDKCMLNWVLSDVVGKAIVTVVGGKRTIDSDSVENERWDDQRGNTVSSESGYGCEKRLTWQNDGGTDNYDMSSGKSEEEAGNAPLH